MSKRKLTEQHKVTIDTSWTQTIISTMASLNSHLCSNTSFIDTWLVPDHLVVERSPTKLKEFTHQILDMGKGKHLEQAIKLHLVEKTLNKKLKSNVEVVDLLKKSLDRCLDAPPQIETLKNKAAELLLMDIQGTFPSGMSNLRTNWEDVTEDWILRNCF